MIKTHEKVGGSRSLTFSNVSWLTLLTDPTSSQAGTTELQRTYDKHFFFYGGIFKMMCCLNLPLTITGSDNENMVTFDVKYAWGIFTERCNR